MEHLTYLGLLVGCLVVTAPLELVLRVRVYARWRRLDNVGLAVATDLFNRLFTNDIAPLRLVRDAGLALVNHIGPARRFFMQEAGGATGDLPRLLRGEAL